MELNPHKYQKACLNWMLQRIFVEQKKGAGVFADPGLGKTVITLLFVEAMRALGDTRPVLVIAPLRVVDEVWPAEVSVWGFDLKLVVVHGSPAKRRKLLATPADMYVTTPGLVEWLLAEPYLPDFSLCVLDESTKFKNWTANCTKALRKLVKAIPRRIILTGDPAANSYKDLFSQIFFLDDGETLGKNVTYFRKTYCHRGGFRNHDWLINEGAGTSIKDAIAPLVYRLAAEDHLDMPPIIYNKVWVSLPPKIQAAYKQVEKELFAALDNGERLEASGASAKYSMCRGIANGGVYQTDDATGERSEMHLHKSKLNAVSEIVGELQGKSALVPYLYNHDLHRLQERFPNAPVIKGGVKRQDCKAILADWNARKIPVLLCQPQAMSHGLNLQRGGNDVIWHGITDLPEVHNQLNRRLWRQGIKGQVRIHYVMARDTVDEAVFDRITNKSKQQKKLLDSINEYRREAA